MIFWYIDAFFNYARLTVQNLKPECKHEWIETGYHMNDDADRLSFTCINCHQKKTITIDPPELMTHEQRGNVIYVDFNVRNR